MHPFWSRLAVLTLYASTAVVAEAQDLQSLAAKVGVKILAEASSDKQMLARTKQRMPFNRMSVGARQRANVILGDLSQYRRMPSLRYPVNPNIYQFLINHPDVAVSTWRAMGISSLQMSQVADFEFTASAADGSEGEADVLWRDGNQCLFIVDGRYSSPILPSAIEASALVWLQYRFSKGSNDEYLVNQQVETFIRFPSAAVDTIARMATRLTNTILDRNVFEVSLYARMMSQAAATDPMWIEQVAQRLDGVSTQRKVDLVRVSRGLRPGQRASGSFSVTRTQTPDLRSSGQFRKFEVSMKEVKAHVPLVPAVPIAATDTLNRDSASIHGAPRSTVSGLMDAPTTNAATQDEVATPMQFYAATAKSHPAKEAASKTPKNASIAAASDSSNDSLKVKSVSVSRESTDEQPENFEPPPVPPSQD